MKVKIGREIDPNNDNVRTYTSRAELTGVVCMAERGMPISNIDGISDNPFAEELLLIPGVEGCLLKPYTVRVLKAVAYDWAEIEPALLRLFGAFNTGEGRLEEDHE